MSLLISNTKLSAKIPDRSLLEIEENCIQQKIDYSTYNNYIVFRSSNFTYTIFKKKSLKNCDKTSDSKQHANITVRNSSKIEEAIILLKKILQYDKDVNIPFKIDNLTATAALGKSVNVNDFLQSTRNISDKISFNPEKFPAIFIRHKNGTILLFRSGILNILGCKSTEELNETFSWIRSICANI